MTALRVAIVADLLEEQWPSMDLVADMLMEHLHRDHAGDITATLVRPPLRRRALGLPAVSTAHAAFTADRFANRLWDYPRHVRRLPGSHDVFHVVDHSYAHLVHGLPAARVLVTCHDLDTFRSVLQPHLERRSLPFRVMTRRILDGLRKAGHVACDTKSTREALVTHAGLAPARTSVVHNGPHPSCTPEPEPAVDTEAARVMGAGRGPDLLHVGSTIARKRIDILLRVFAGVRARHSGARLIRVGGPLSGEQRALVRELGVEGAVVTLPFLDRRTLAAVYRRSTLVLLTSEREGFGLPVLEALACGTPVVASGIGALREVGGEAVDYCAPDDVAAWIETVERTLSQMADPVWLAARRAAGLARASAFSWSKYTADVVSLYRRLAPGNGGR
jgi:glycosyltransferase involved in cell wall biosynthesis